MQDTLAAVEVDGHVLPETGDAAEVVGGPRPVFQDRQDLHAVGCAHSAADTALGIDARRHEGVGLGQHPYRRGAQRNSVSCTMPRASMLYPDKAASWRHDSGAAEYRQAGVEAENLDLPHFSQVTFLEELPHHIVAFEPEGAGHNLRH